MWSIFITLTPGMILIYVFILFFILALLIRFAHYDFLEQFFPAKMTYGLRKLRQMKRLTLRPYSMMLKEWQTVNLKNDHLISVYRLAQQKEIEKYESVIDFDRK
jgi:hypothetical protein